MPLCKDRELNLQNAVVYFSVAQSRVTFLTHENILYNKEGGRGSEMFHF
jgi:hypothetical protein